MTDFEQLVSELGDGYRVYFDCLPPDDQMALVGRYLLEEYRQPNEIEPIVEALCPDVGEESEHAINLYDLMADGGIGLNDGKKWLDALTSLIVNRYRGLVQDAIDKAQEDRRDDDIVYEMERDRRMMQ